MINFKPFHVAIAAEAITAAQFARLGYDVSVQYGANQPEYDLIISKDDQQLKISVKGSNDGSWGLCQSYIQKGEADYHNAIEKWVKKHKPNTVLCFVQFKSKELYELPNLYLAKPIEVAERLKNTANNRGDTVLYENKVWTKRAFGFGTIDKIPDDWKFSELRLKQLFK